MSRRDEILSALANGAITEAQLNEKISVGIFKGQLLQLTAEGVVIRYGDPPMYSLASNG